ncbi:hypothetical protein P153DRAFT_95661 [Dothidotthia symphoricarpi CBS 119687]|uniref:Uncharacterized protein n=1 Tax=Dothidotthia symphoricarpi CBS 119687 TaxID=1392245 RepID=A0A6A6A5K6_9PLEO|nr:uncharacterized protein P153DRAFT_95661 [Dothidotthia symphoricarpi CBS 119687]KAF2125891.1 hypothetical protein P153DRAFT_95661 [Dothidotthia symphoricarpi CBS 119687]
MSDFGTEFGRQEKNEPTSPSQARVTERDSAPKEPEQEFLKLNVAENKPAVEDSEGAAKPSTHEPAVAQPSDVVEKDVTDQSPHAGNVPETGSSYKDVAKKDIPEQDLGLKKDVTEEDSPSKKDVAEPKAVAVEDDVKKDVVEDVVAEKVAAKQDPVANDDVVSKDASGPFIPLQEDARPESASKEVAGSSHPKPQSSTDSSSSAKPDITREEPAPSPHDDVVGERAVESSPSHNDAAPIPSSTKDVDGSLSSTPQGSTEQKPAEKEIDNRKVVKEVLPFPPQQASTPQNVDEQSPSTKQVSTPQDVSGQPSKEEKSPVSNTTSQPDQPAGLISSITSLLPSLTAQEPSATQQPTTTERSTSEPEEDNTLSSFIKAGQNLIGIGAGTPPQTSSSVSPTVPQSTSSQNPSSEGSTLTGLLQAGKDLVGLGTDKPTHEPSGGLPSTSDKSIAYVPTSTQGSTIARPSMNDEIPAIHDAGKHVPSVQQGLPDALGLFSASTPQQSSLTSVSHPSILQELASVNRDSKFPDTARAGEHSPRIGSYGSSSRDSSSRPYGGPVTSDRSRHGSVADGPTSYHDTSKPLTERLYHPSGSHSSSRPSSLYESAVPSGESYTAQLERLYNASGGSRRSSLYEPASYSPNLASSSELPSLATARTSSSRPSSLYESSSSSTHKPFSTLNPQYSPTLGKSLHEQSAMHHSLPSRQSPSSVADRGSVSGLSYSGHSPASYSTSGLSATPYSPSLAEGSYTQQILAGQTNLHIPGFEESAFKVPDTDHVEQSIEGGEVKFSGIAQDERGRKR